MWGRIGRGGLGEGSERKKGREEREMISWERRRERRGEVYRELFISLFTHSHTNKKTDTHMFYIYILSPQTRTDSHLKTNFTLFASSTELRAWWRFNQFFLSPVSVASTSCHSPLGMLIENALSALHQKRAPSSTLSYFIYFKQIISELPEETGPSLWHTLHANMEEITH